MSISFSAVKVLPALLKETKLQTIRPAFIMCDTCRGYGCYNAGTLSPDRKQITSYEPSKTCEDCKGKGYFEKAARYKVGQVTSAFWKQRSIYSYFCKKCGQDVEIDKMGGVRHSCKTNPKERQKDWDELFDTNDSFGRKKFDRLFFEKKMGTLEITDVFKLWLEHPVKDHYDTKIILRYEEDKEKDGAIWKRDGFDSIEGFEDYFGDYRLRIANGLPFWVYRYKWVKKNWK